MALIDSTYFVGEINLPVGKYSDLDLFIARLEKQFLNKALGYRLTKLVIDNDVSIADLIAGTEFTSEDYELMEWEGFTNTGKESVIAYYVYYYYLRSKVTFTTSTGEKKPDNENSTDATPAFKVMRAWDLMLKGLERMDAYIQTVPELLDIYEPADMGRVNAFDL